MSKPIAILLFCASAFIAQLLPAKAEVQKIMHICNQSLCPELRPQVSAPDGWVEDKQASGRFNVVIFVPKGKTFANAPAILYADATYNRDQLPLQVWVTNSNDKWLAVHHDAKIGLLSAAAADYIMDAFETPDLQNQPFEIIAHYADTDSDGNAYVVRLVDSGLDKKAVDAARPVLEKWLSALHPPAQR